MISGYVAGVAARRRPFIRAEVQFPPLGTRRFLIDFLVDTGADRTVIGPRDVEAMDIDLRALPQGRPMLSAGGRRSTLFIEAVISLGATDIELPLTILAPASAPLQIPSILGREVLAQFALFIELRTNRVLLFDPAEASALRFPAGGP